MSTRSTTAAGSRDPPAGAARGRRGRAPARRLRQGGPAGAGQVGAHVGAAKTPQGKAAESAYLAALRGAGVPITAQSTIDGYSVCVVLNQGTTADDAATEAKQTFDLPADEAAKLVAAAQATLCQLAGKPR